MTVTETTETTGTWELDPSRSSVEFEVPSLWGLATVKGRFERYEGTLNASSRPAVALSVEAHSLNTKNKRRDKHLGSEDFFDAANHPRVRFGADAPDLAGDSLKATALLGQRRLGMTWSPLGVVRAPSKLTVRGRLIRTEDAR